MKVWLLEVLSVPAVVPVAAALADGGTCCCPPGPPGRDCPLLGRSDVTLLEIRLVSGCCKGRQPAQGPVVGVREKRDLVPLVSPDLLVVEG